MWARWQHHAPGARSLKGIDVVVHHVADRDGNRLLAIGHVQRDVAGRTDIGVDEVFGGAPDVAADRFLARQTHKLEPADVGAGLAGAVGGKDDIVEAFLDVQLHEPLQRLQKTKPNEILN